MSRHERSCGAVLFREAAEGPAFLLICHVDGGHWAFPKGHMEPGETEEETAKREIREETGLLVRLDPGFRRSVRYSPKPGVDKDVIYFLGFPTGGNPAVQKEEIREIRLQTEEIAASRWLPEAEARQLVTYDNDRQVLEGAIAYLGRERKA